MRCVSILQIAVLCLLFGQGAARGFDGASAWQEKSAQFARLVVDRIDGVDYLLFELSLAPGWHSYWRHPGASGIAPAFTALRADGVRLGAPIFPAPHFFDDGVGGFNGYEGSMGVVFPLTVAAPARRVELQFRAELGICREICIPVRFDLRLSAPPAAMRGGKYQETIRAYLARRPSAPSDRLRIASASYDGDALQFVIIGERLTAPRLMLVPNAQTVLGAQRIMGRGAEGFIVEVPAWSPLDKPLIGQRIEVLLRAGEQAIVQKVKISEHAGLTDKPKTRSKGDDD